MLARPLRSCSRLPASPTVGSPSRVPAAPVVWPRRTAAGLALGLGLLLARAAAGVPGPADPCAEAGSALPCSYDAPRLALQPVPRTIKLQARVAQAKLPEGQGRFARLIVQLLDGAAVVCSEELQDVVVDRGVLNLEIGRKIDCALEQVVAEKAALSFRLCLGGPERCLHAVPLGATLMALKSSYAVRAGQAQRAVVAGRASYAHRLTADRDLLQPPSLGYGYFDFRTPPAAPALHTNDAFAEYASGGFLQWSPVREAAPTLHLAAADQASGRLLLLDRLQLGALTTEAMGRLEVRQDGLRALGSSEFDGKLSLRGQLKVEQPAAGLAGHGQDLGASSLTYSLPLDDGSGFVEVGPLQPAVTAPAALVVVAGDSRSTGTLSVNAATELLGGVDIKGDTEVRGTTSLDGLLRVEVPEAAGRPQGLKVQGRLLVDGKVRASSGLIADDLPAALSGAIELTGSGEVQGKLIAKSVTVRGNLDVDDLLDAHWAVVLEHLGPGLDPDSDGRPTQDDNCVFTPNPDQLDRDLDGVGDACDPDIDGDRVPEDPRQPRPDTDGCNGLDDDGDGLTDEGFVSRPCATGQLGRCGDGRLLCRAGVTLCLPVMGAAPADVLCDGVDEDCDGSLDEDAPDADGDGQDDCDDLDDDNDGDPDASDCRRLDPAFHHGAEEVCDGLDNDCDGAVDEGFPDTDGNRRADCIDPDDDGDGDPDGSDCRPLDPAVHRRATEVCDGVDNDCDGAVDEGFLDMDHDGQADCIDDDDDGDGDPDLTDCQPLDPARHAAAPEVCNGLDDDCNDLVDDDRDDTDGDGINNCADPDDDGDGDPDLTDCRPLDPAFHHGAAEPCDGADNDCSGAADEGHTDTDGDAQADCVDPDDDNDGDPDLTDCQPLDPAIRHGAAELCDGVDNNCSGTVDEGYTDTDRDGQADCVDPDDDNDGDPDASDCNDTDPAIRHGAAEACDGVDNNCNGTVDEGYTDTDRDGQADCVDPDDDNDGDPDASDCNDTDPAIRHGAAELCDGVDNNCSGATDEGYTDTDGDGQADCVDPDDDNDGDPDASDCDHLDRTRYHGATEVCNQRDDDCDAQIDEGICYRGGGFTFYQAASLTSCNKACNGLGLYYEPGGSDGWAINIDNCEQIGAAFGYPLAMRSFFGCDHGCKRGSDNLIYPCNSYNGPDHFDIRPNILLYCSCSPFPAARVGGYVFYQANLNQSCNSVCSALGKAYDANGGTWLKTQANCDQILAARSLPASGRDPGCWAGCWQDSGGSTISCPNFEPAAAWPIARPFCPCR